MSIAVPDRGRKSDDGTQSADLQEAAATAAVVSPDVTETLVFKATIDLRPDTPGSGRAPFTSPQIGANEAIFWKGDDLRNATPKRPRGEWLRMVVRPEDLRLANHLARAPHLHVE